MADRPLTVAVCIPTLPSRSDRLNVALASVTSQIRCPDEIHVATDTAGLGEAATRNRALSAATTDYVAFLDDDDVMYPQHLAVLVEAASATGADLVYPWFTCPGAGPVLARAVAVMTAEAFGQPFDSNRAAALRSSNYIPVTYMVRTELALKVGGFPSPDDSPPHPYPPHQPLTDWGFLIRLLDAGARFHHVAERTWEWRQWDGNSTTQHVKGASL